MEEHAAKAAQAGDRMAPAIIVIMMAVFIDTMGFGIILPVLPTYLEHLTGATLPEATRIGGLLIVVFATLQFLFGPFVGNLSDRFGRRPVLILSMVAFGANYFLMGIANNLAILFVGRAFTGVAGAIYAPANAYMADISPPEKRAQRFALIGAAFGMGFIFGPALGGLLGSLDPRAPFFVAAGLALVNAGLAYIFLGESLPPERRRAFNWRRANPLGAVASLRRFPSVLGVIGAIFLWQLAFHVYPSTWSFFAMLKFGWTEQLIGLSLASSGILMVIVQGGLTGRIVRFMGERRAAFLGFGSFIVGCILYALIPYGWMVFAVQFTSAWQGVSGAAMQSIISRRTPSDQQGELQGAVASVNGLGAIIGPLAMTQTLAYFSDAARSPPFHGAAFALATLLAMAAAGLFYASTRTDRSAQLPQGAATG